MKRLVRKIYPKDHFADRPAAVVADSLLLVAALAAVLALAATLW